MPHERLFDYPFNFQEYIEKKLREFDDVEERKFAKTILVDGLMHMITETESKYAALEKRVYDEIVNDKAKYTVQSTLIDRAAFDPTNPNWFPILADAMKPFLVENDALWDAMHKKEPIDLTHVFIEAPDTVCREILAKRRELPGVVQTDLGDISAVFQLQKSQYYRQEISLLYDLFLENQIPWVTVHTAYLDKCLVLTLLRLEQDVPDGAKWQGIHVDYVSYDPFVCVDKIPLWNIEKLSYNSMPFPMPCIDSVNYEHVFPIKEFGAENGYLIEPRAEIAEIRYEEGQLIVVSPGEAFTGWQARKIVVGHPPKSLGYDSPILSNAAKNCFTKSYLRHMGVVLKTKAELIRRIKALDIDRFLCFMGYEILNDAAPATPPEDMNWFLQDELFDCQGRRVLLLTFEALQPGHYLNDAMLRFAVSSIQALESEFRCVGVINGK